MELRHSCMKIFISQKIVNKLKTQIYVTVHTMKNLSCDSFQKCNKVPNALNKLEDWRNKLFWAFESFLGLNKLKKIKVMQVLICFHWQQDYVNRFWISLKIKFTSYIQFRLSCCLLVINLRSPEHVKFSLNITRVCFLVYK